jgi:SAM-dependent methyltransferase
MNEEQQLPTYEEAVRRAGIGPGQRVLDIGCGSGVFLHAAAARGAQVFGLDASSALLELARSRVPGAELRLGDMEALPYESDVFDVVAGFNSFFFASDMVAALREAGRVAKPGAPVVIQVWGRPERCDLTAMKRAIASVAPPGPPGVPPPPALWEPGVLEEMATAAGLTPVEAFDLAWAYAFAEEETLGRAMLSPGLVVELLGSVGEEAVRSAIVAALEPYRTPDGGYRLENEWHFVIARAP